MWMANSIFLILCLVFIGLGGRDLYYYLTYSNVAAAGRILERTNAATMEPERATLPRTLEASIPLDEALATCIDSVAKSVVTVRLFDWEQRKIAGNRDEFAAETVKVLHTVERYLTCFPTDGNAWLWRAKLLRATAAPSAKVLASARISYWLAPAERWIMLPRFAFVAPLMTSTDFVSLRTAFELDLGNLVRGLQPYEVAELYVGSGAEIRAMFLEIFERESLVRKVALMKEINRLGVTAPIGP